MRCILSLINFFSQKWYMMLFLPVHSAMMESVLGRPKFTRKGAHALDGTSGPVDVKNPLPNIKKLEEL